MVTNEICHGIDDDRPFVTETLTNGAENAKVSDYLLTRILNERPSGE